MSIFDLSGIQSQAGLKHVEFHPTLDSTNSLALELISDLIPHRPALVLTEIQTAGRGRGSHQWFSAAGALTFSLVLDVSALPPSRRSLISLATGIAVCQVLEEAAKAFRSHKSHEGRSSSGRRFQVKWPNDILVDGRKLSGILTELNTDGGQATVVIGVGVNVNNSLSSLPADVQSVATSLYDLGCQSLDLSSVLIPLLNGIQTWCTDLENHPKSVILELNQRNALLGGQVTVDMAGDQIQGRCEGVDESGRLVLMTDLGQQKIMAGSITQWSPASPTPGPGIERLPCE